VKYSGAAIPRHPVLRHTEEVEIGGPCGQTATGAALIHGAGDHRDVRGFAEPPQPHRAGGPGSDHLLFFALHGQIHSDPPMEGTQLTIPLCKWDITFWREGKCVPHDSQLDTLTTVDMVTVNLGNQKNRRKDTKMNHARSGYDAFDPVSSLA
jgi:hypothetical protein